MSSWLFAAMDPAVPPQPVVRRIMVQDELIIRIPVRPPRVRQPIEWVESKGPKCLSSRYIAGATLSAPSSIDFLLRDRSRLRARIDDRCPALDFYDGFYLEPEDDRICAKREEIKTRMGGSCRIERFRTLTPKPKL